MALYRGHDLKIIQELLKEIGAHRYEMALRNMKVQQKPMGMKGWYLESSEHYLRLCHRYPSGYILMLMDVDRCDNIPRKGWERIKVER
ncbi:hypothetical protein [Ulvibacterium marinum]|uniref:Uncharacterized protein n=1 Tax=Ulvibacterium marinum TaxID=2419782 RepID=A0A3B0CGS9_9FLAO|nr:hypothetical protein [Ulvibacterium marinum]RKN83357.1 hypothetical protein D7Z94_05905 [Ulvibacterium marinum]